MMISARYDRENYAMRGHAGRRSDQVERFNRKINGKAFEFSRVRWASGNVTVRVWAGGTTTVLHEWYS